MEDVGNLDLYGLLELQPDCTEEETLKSVPLIAKKGARNAQCFPNFPVLYANERVTAFLEGDSVLIYDSRYSERFNKQGCFGVLQPEHRRNKPSYKPPKQHPPNTVTTNHDSGLTLHSSQNLAFESMVQAFGWFDVIDQIDRWPTSEQFPPRSAEFWTSASTDYRRFLLDELHVSVRASRKHPIVEADETQDTVAKQLRLSANSNEQQHTSDLLQTRMPLPGDSDMLESSYGYGHEAWHNSIGTESSRQFATRLTKPKPRHGRGRSNVFVLRLSVEETLFLFFATRSISRVIDASRGAFDALSVDAFARCCALFDPHFAVRYCVYQHFRSRGWILRTGLKFGVDFVAYRDGPHRFHASFSIVARTVHPVAKQDEVEEQASADVKQDEDTETGAELKQDEVQETSFDYEDANADEQLDDDPWMTREDPLATETLCASALPLYTTFNDNASPSEFAGLSRVTEHVRKQLIYAFVTYCPATLDNLIRQEHSDTHTDTDTDTEGDSDDEGQMRLAAFLRSAHVTCFRVLRWNANAQRDADRLSAGRA